MKPQCHYTQDVGKYLSSFGRKVLSCLVSTKLEIDRKIEGMPLMVNNLNTEIGLQIEDVGGPTSIAASYLEVGGGHCFIPKKSEALTQSPPDVILEAPSKVHWDNFLDEKSVIALECIDFPNDIRVCSEAKKDEKMGKRPKCKIAAKNSVKIIKTQMNINKAKVSFRKDKSCSAVKSWLDDMNKNNGPETKDDSTFKGNASRARDFGDSVQKRRKLKITQSQLTNKNGVMKFTKPEGIDPQ